MLKRTIGTVANIEGKRFGRRISVMERESTKTAIVAAADALPTLFDQ
jgi:hypothetical protein